MELEGFKNKRVAILVDNGFEEVELTAPREELISMGVEVEIISDGKEVKSWKNGNWGESFETDVQIEQARPDQYDALILPGGVINPDHLRRNPKAVDLIKKFDKEKKLISAICHGPQMLIEADLVKNKELTSFFSVRKDLENAGAKWKDEAVVKDERLITSRNPDDLPVFMKEINNYLKTVGN